MNRPCCALVLQALAAAIIHTFDRVIGIEVGTCRDGGAAVT
jgi:hypothetical protein